MTRFISIQLWVLSAMLGGSLGTRFPIPTVAQADCSNPLTQSQMNSCAARSAQESDKKLNQAYQQLKSSLSDKQQKQRLTEAQLAWLKFRDAHCAFERGVYSGGSIAPTIYYSCLSEVTQQRTKQIQSDLDEFQKR
jgi:uncharacterized protein YecT (DUF1311 family)